MSLEAFRAKSSHALEKVSPTRALFGNMRDIRIRELPKNVVMKILHPKEPAAIPAPKPRSY